MGLAPSLPSMAAAGDLVAQRALAASILDKLSGMELANPFQVALGEMWARIAAVHPAGDDTDLLRLAAVLEVASRSADGFGLPEQAALYRAEMISITTDVADGSSVDAEPAAVLLEALVARSAPLHVRCAQSMRRHRSIPVEAGVPLTDSVRDVLAPAAERAGQDWDKIEQMLATGHMLLWRYGSFCVTTEVDQDDICNIRLGGGSDAKAAVGPLEHAITIYPAHREVRKYRIWGRRGWRRLFPHWRDCGVEDDLLILERDA